MQTPMSGAPKLRARSGRTPLQPKNSPAVDPSKPKAKQKQPPIEISVIPDSEKENRPIVDASLADELEAMKKKVERLRVEKERTEKTLKERDTVLDAKMKELQHRGDIQKNLEIQVDRLFRLKELKSRCLRVSPMRTLRQKEQQKIIIVNQPPSESELNKTQEMVASESESETESECREECEMQQSPGSASSQTRS